MREGVLEIGQFAEGTSEAWQVTFAHNDDRRRFDVENLRARVAARGLGDECCAGGCEALYGRRVERLPGPASQSVTTSRAPRLSSSDVSVATRAMRAGRAISSPRSERAPAPFHHS